MSEEAKEPIITEPIEEVKELEIECPKCPNCGGDTAITADDVPEFVCKECGRRIY